MFCSTCVIFHTFYVHTHHVHFCQVLEHKLIYLETKDVVETTLALDNYKRACDSGRGAVFLSVARGTHAVRGCVISVVNRH